MTGWLLTFAIAVSATPSPMPVFIPPPTVFRPPPTIIHERVSPVCNALHNLVLPLARMQTQYKHGTTQIRKYERQLAKYYDSKMQDGVQMYAAKIDMEATNLIASIHGVELLLQKSYRAYPQDTNPKVDALRQRVQNIVDLERATANRYSEVAGMIVDNADTADLSNSVSAFGTASQIATPTPLPIYMPPSLRTAPDTDPALSDVPPSGVPARMLKFYALPQLKTALDTEGRALISQALIAARDCDGA